MALKDKNRFMANKSHHNHLLHSGDTLPKDRPQLISDTGQQESKERNPQQSVDYTEDPASLCVRRDVPKS